MTPYERYYIPEAEGAAESKRALIAAFVLLALFALFAYVAPHDPTKVLSRVPCAVVSEQQVSDVLGAPMRLLPTSGTVCQYASTSGESTPALFVIARSNPNLPVAGATNVPLTGIGDAAILASDALYVRYGARSYKFTMAPQSPNDASTSGEELRLAAMMTRPTVAQSR
jgi:hypothetical protein